MGGPSGPGFEPMGAGGGVEGPSLNLGTGTTCGPGMLGWLAGPGGMGVTAMGGGASGPGSVGGGGSIGAGG